MNAHNDEFNTIKNMYRVLIALLLGTVVAGFAFFYYMHGRISVLEYANAQGARFTLREFVVFKSSYETDRGEVRERLAALERITQHTATSLAEININIEHLVNNFAAERGKNRN